MRKLIIVGGVLNLLLAVPHLFFPVLFGWREALAPLAADQRQLIYALGNHSTLVIFGFGVISVAAPSALLTERSGRLVSALIAAFYALRVAEEWLLFTSSLAEVIVLTVLCAGLAAIYVLPFTRFAAPAPALAPSS